MIFKIYGPYPIKLDDYGNIPASLTEFWDTIEESHDGLSTARGCYVFGISSSGGKRIAPWYIGKTNRQTFDAECFKSHQRNHYSKAINYYQRARPHLYLIPQLTNSGRFSTAKVSNSIAFVETYLIGFGLWANEELLNKRDTKLYREIELPGFLNSKTGKPGKSSNELQRTFYFDKF